MSDEKGQVGPARRLKREPPAIDEPVRGSTPTPQRPYRDIWRSRTAWPFVPSGYLYVPDVFERVGKARFGDTWTGEEATFRGNVPAFPRPRLVFDGDSDVIVHLNNYRSGQAAVAALLGINPDRRPGPITNREWCQATDWWLHLDVVGPFLTERRQQVIEIIHRAAEAGDLTFYIRDHGDMLPVKRSAWNCEPELVRQRVELGLLNDAPLQFVRLLYGGRTIPFFARETELTFFLENGATDAEVSTLASAVRGAADTGPETPQIVSDLPASLREWARQRFDEGLGWTLAYAQLRGLQRVGGYPKATKRKLRRIWGEWDPNPKRGPKAKEAPE